jgi:hypothetical protein
MPAARQARRVRRAPRSSRARKPPAAAWPAAAKRERPNPDACSLQRKLLPEARREQVELAVVGLVLWRFLGLLRRVGRLERDAAAVDARLRGLEKALRGAEDAAKDVEKAEKAVAGAAWDLGKALRLPW